SGFQALRVVRDTDVDVVLINPQLQAAGVSGADIARTIKSAAQFRKLPVLFLLHEGGAVPEGAKVDGAVEVDAWTAARRVTALNAAVDEIRHGAASDAARSERTAGDEIVEVAVRQYLEGEGRAAAEQLLAALAQQMLPAIAEPIAREMLPAIAERLALEQFE